MNDRAHRRLQTAARELLLLAEHYPELFEHVVTLTTEDIDTLREIAFPDEDHDHAAD
jgi:hypothetical protein